MTKPVTNGTQTAPPKQKMHNPTSNEACNDTDTDDKAHAVGQFQGHGSCLMGEAKPDLPLLAP